MPRDVSRQQYEADFADGANPNGKRREALKEARDNRKFEIELYWKRATYFWTFIAAAFTGFFLLQADNNFDLTYALACLGFIFSLAWHLVN